MRGRRSYRPSVESLEALRLLSIATGALPTLAVEQDVLPTAAPLDAAASLSPSTTTSGNAWDAALADQTLAELFGPPSTPTAPADTVAGLAQLNRYLSRAWGRAGIAPQQYDDCTQAVYATLLQSVGRDQFDQLAAQVGQTGVPAVFNRDTPAGPVFFRAVDTVKKRAQRERNFQSIDAFDASTGLNGLSASDQWRAALLEAIGQTLNQREAELIHATLEGQTPAEIAKIWGVAPKTVSNEKTRAIQKLRDALTADLAD